MTKCRITFSQPNRSKQKSIENISANTDHYMLFAKLCKQTCNQWIYNLAGIKQKQQLQIQIANQDREVAPNCIKKKTAF